MRLGGRWYLRYWADAVSPLLGVAQHGGHRLGAGKALGGQRQDPPAVGHDQPGEILTQDGGRRWR